MKHHLSLLIAWVVLTLLCFGCTSRPKVTCTHWGPETGAKRTIILTNGMPLTSAENLLQGVGARKVAGDTPLWGGLSQTNGRGYHQYFELPDRTCLQLKVTSDARPETVVGFRVGPRGKPYIDKFAWREDEQAGRVHAFESITLADGQIAPGFNDK